MNLDKDIQRSGLNYQTFIPPALEYDQQDVDIREDNNSEKVNPKKFSLNARQWLFLGVLGTANVFRGVYMVIVGPFYPSLAKDRGLSDSEIGFVMGSLDFSTFLVCIIFGKILIPKLGPTLVLKLSTINLGLCSLLFGCIELIDEPKTFLGVSFAIRILSGLGDGGFYPSAFTIFAQEFTGNVSTAIGIFEFLFGVGAIVGPLLFGSFIDAVGFQVVYSIVGVLLLGSGIIYHFCVPHTIAPKPLHALEPEEEEMRGGKPWYHLVMIPPLLLVVANFFTAAASIGFISGTLEGHLEQFSLSTFETSAVFIVSNAIYTILTPLWGMVSDASSRSSDHQKGCQFGRWLDKDFVLSLGCGLITLGFCFMGPLPFLGAGRSYLWSTLVALALHGIGLGAAVTTSFPQAVNIAISHGFKANDRTFALLSSLYQMTFALGNSVGPSVSGVLVDNVGFPDATLFVVVMGLFVFLMSLISRILRLKREK